MTRTGWILGVLLVVTIVVYMTAGVQGSWRFAMTLRAEKLAALLVVAVAISTATLLFQTATGNRILTPSLIGFDALYVMIVSVAIFTLGAYRFIALPEAVVFMGNALVMCLAALALFSWLLKPGMDLMRIVLTGIIMGAMFRAFSTLVMRMIDPNEYAIIADFSYASFSSLETGITAVAAVICALGFAAAWRMRYRLDVLALGRDTATGLGVNFRRATLQAMAIVSLLVSVSTALVGPVAFLGLLVVSLAYRITPTSHHGALLITSAVLSAITLIGGQAVMERVFAFETPLAVVIDFIGGVFFLFLVFKRVRA